MFMCGKIGNFGENIKKKLYLNLLLCSPVFRILQYDTHTLVLLIKRGTL